MRAVPYRHARLQSVPDLTFMQPHILYAQDDRDNREMVQILLQQEGFRVSVTGDATEILELLASDHFDALLLDNRMPYITGVELCRRIRSFDQNTPILFCSGALTEADKREAFEAGAQAYFGKPFDLHELTASLRAVLNIVQP